MTGLLATLPGLSRDHVVSNSLETLMTSVKIRQDGYEKQLDRLQVNMISMNAVIQNTEASYRECGKPEI